MGNSVGLRRQGCTQDCSPGVKAAPGLHSGGGTSFVAKNAEFGTKKRMDKGEENGGI
jgi:hypothetical protein